MIVTRRTIVFGFSLCKVSGFATKPNTLMLRTCCGRRMRFRSSPERRSRGTRDHTNGGGFSETARPGFWPAHACASPKAHQTLQLRQDLLCNVREPMSKTKPPRLSETDVLYQIPLVLCGSKLSMQSSLHMDIFLLPGNLTGETQKNKNKTSKCIFAPLTAANKYGIFNREISTANVEFAGMETV